ncbi:insulinase family protein [Pseudomonas entomophila]|uniref:M16 family metallopeptidase n=1 Tax=Pseudomonas entomophila TaxID=312306 RepID=UPI0015E3E8DC|nr:pitrilysin family protein [Pseudomonas entomophila]MBA1188314.1 insulinase family protein [Pseudomonas entomophila]
MSNVPPCAPASSTADARCSPRPAALAEENPLALLTSAAHLDLDRLERLDIPVQAWQTDAGSRVLFVPSSTVPMIDVTVRFAAGAAYDGDLPGLAAMTLHMLDKGTQRHDAAAFAQALEGSGALLGKTIDADHATLTLRTLSEATFSETALGLFEDVLARPAFAPALLATVKGQFRAYQQGRRQLAYHRVRAAVPSHLFAGHPYAHYYGSVPDSLSRLTVDDLRAYHRRAYSARNLQVSIVGDLSRERAQAIAHRLSLGLNQNWASIELPAVQPREQEIVHLEQAGATSQIAIACPIDTVPGSDADLALLLGNQVLGEGLNSRLMQELRVRRGLTYGIRSVPQQLRAAGFLGIYWDVAPQYTDASQTLVEALVDRFVEEGPSEREVGIARQQIAGQWLKQVAENGRLVNLLAYVNQQGLDETYLTTYLDRLAAVEPRQVREAFALHVHRARQVAVSAGPDVPQVPLP